MSIQCCTGLCYSLFCVTHYILLQDDALSMAVRCEDVDSVKRLLKKGVDVNQKDWVCSKYLHVQVRTFCNTVLGIF